MLNSVAQHGIQRGWLLTEITQQDTREITTGGKLCGIHIHHAPLQPPPFRNVLRIVSERPLIEKGGDDRTVISNGY